MSLLAGIRLPNHSRDGLIAILDGVKAGETVVSAGQNKLFRGATVTVDESVKF